MPLRLPPSDPGSLPRNGMADRIALNADLAVDELRRKGRRRLVGAIVVALAAAVLVPLLLEKEPRPLGDDVSVQIPPVDEGKFVNRLNARPAETTTAPKNAERVGPKAPAAEPAPERKPEGKSEGKSEARSEASATPPAPAPAAAVAPSGKSIADAEQRVLSPTSKPLPQGDPKPPVQARPVAQPPAVIEAKPAPVTPAPKLEAKAASAPTVAPVPPRPDSFVVQLAAFADDKGANALAGKLKKAAYAAYVEPVQTSRGTLWRVRVGGYASRSDADAARVKLKSEGYSGIVAAGK